MLVADLGGDPVGRVLRGERVQAEALGRRLPHARALEEVEGAQARRRAPARSAASAARPRATTVSTRPRPPCAWLARRSTAMISATSDSTAVTTSAVATWSLEMTESRRSRDSASAGKRLERFEGHRQAPAVALVLVALAGAARRSGRAAADRRATPRPAALGRSCAGLGLRLGFGVDFGFAGSLALPWKRLPACVRVGLRRSTIRVGRSVEPLSAAQRRTVERRCGADLRAGARSGARERGVDAPQRLLAAEQRDALEDPRRDRRARDRHAQRLVDLARLAPRGCATSAFERLRRRRPRRSSAPAPAPRARRRASRGPARPSQRSRALASSTGPSSSGPASGQKSASVWIFSWLISTARAKPRVLARIPHGQLARGTSPTRSTSSCSGQRADVDAVQPAAASPRRSAPGCG